MRKIYNTSAVNTAITNAVDNAERCAELIKEVKSAPLVDKLLNLYEEYWSFIEDLSNKAIEDYNSYSERAESLKSQLTYAVLMASFEEED